MNLLHVVQQLFEQYGYFVLLIGLPLDFIALPIPPGNSTLAYTGYLSFKGVLAWLPAFAAALTGAFIGVTVTYWIGHKLGMPLIERYGKWLSLKPSLVEKTRRYYDKYGDKLLLIAFFVPGVRQFLGYFIGIIRIPYRKVVIYAYAGAALWVASFFAVGYVFGEQWERMFMLIERNLKVFFIVLGCAVAGFLLFRWFRRAR
ncbi:DedA family protein [Paenibacillus ehimensis]|uniref:DedA family protein n=1 Tax=Paenibacillus ehimensis TaxID=79264 RepID=A0ABT8VKX3_9BACL|nr:DedA family protein [Paenibacillus ehimensis]MDO3681640.1 DedA family protein [Paenibacillus ehimensis]MEC0212156.1 DedA family protein [Paenibacillus ehimensis]